MLRLAINLAIKHEDVSSDKCLFLKKAALSRSDLLHAPPRHPNRVPNHQSQAKVDRQSQLHILAEHLLSDGVANEVYSAAIRCRQQAAHLINPL